MHKLGRYERERPAAAKPAAGAVAGRQVPMKKHWMDNPRRLGRRRRRARSGAGTCVLLDRPGRGAARDGARAHGRRDRHHLSPLHPQRQPVHAGGRCGRHGRYRNLESAVRLRSDHDRVHLRRRALPHARNQAQALPDLLRRRAPDRCAALRLRSRARSAKPRRSSKTPASTWWT